MATSPVPQDSAPDTWLSSSYYVGSKPPGGKDKDTYFPIGEGVPVTLQVVLGGSDGVILGTDTKITVSPFGSLLREQDRHALELGNVRSGEHGTEKIIFDASRKIAILCSGSQLTYQVGRTIAGDIEAKWSNEYCGPVEDLCREKWLELPVDQRRQADAQSENTVIIVHAEKPRIHKIRFKLDQLEPWVFNHHKSQKLVVLGGDHLNPSGMLLERYLPKKPLSINKLALLAAHYILVGGELNPAGVEGLKLYFSKNSQPFQEIPDTTMQELSTLSERLNRLTQQKLLQAVNF